MGIYLRENGIYYLKVRGQGKYKRISLETSDRKIAQEIYNAYLLDKIKNKLIPTNHSNQNQSNNSPTPSHIQGSSEQKTRLKPLYEEYLESCQIKGLAKATMWYKESLLQDLIKIKVYYLEEINQKKINELAQLWKTERASCSQKQTANLKAFLNYCIKLQKYNSSNYYGLTFLPCTSNNVRETTISEKDYSLMRSKITDTDTDLLLYIDTLWETGCRPNEIVNLKKNDIDFIKGTTKLYQNKTKKYKTVYFTDELLEILQTANLYDNGYLFKGHDRQKEYYAKKFKDLREFLGLNKAYCLYAFRHTFGTRILNKTKDIHLVSKLLGHSDISITAKHYINRSDDDLRRALLESTK